MSKDALKKKIAEGICRLSEEKLREIEFFVHFVKTRTPGETWEDAWRYEELREFLREESRKSEAHFLEEIEEARRDVQLRSGFRQMCSSRTPWR